MDNTNSNYNSHSSKTQQFNVPHRLKFDEWTELIREYRQAREKEKLSSRETIPYSRKQTREAHQ